MVEVTSGSLTAPPSPKKLGRRLFFPVAAAAAVGSGIALYKGRETILDALGNLIIDARGAFLDEKSTNPNLRPSNTTLDPTAMKIAMEIGALTDSALREVYDRKRDTTVYRTAYETLDQAAAKAHAAYQTLTPQHNNAREYRALEINAKMWQAYLLANLTAANIILPEENINLEGIDQLTSGAKLGSSYRKFNRLKALENYEKVERLLDEARSLNIELPLNVCVPLYGNSERVADHKLVYQRMLETIDALLEDQDLSVQYKPGLAAKRTIVERRRLTQTN